MTKVEQAQKNVNDQKAVVEACKGEVAVWKLTAAAADAVLAAAEVGVGDYRTASYEYENARAMLGQAEGWLTTAKRNLVILQNRLADATETEGRE